MDPLLSAISSLVGRFVSLTGIATGLLVHHNFLIGKLDNLSGRKLSSLCPTTGSVILSVFSSGVERNLLASDSF